MSLYIIIYKLTWIIKEGIQERINEKSLNFVQRVYYHVQYKSTLNYNKIIKYTRFMYRAKNR